MLNLIKSRGCIDSALDIIGMVTMAEGSTDPDGYSCA